MAQFSNWENNKLIVEAHHNDLLHSAQANSWRDEANSKRREFVRRKGIISLLLIGIVLFALVGSARAQTHFDAAPHLQRLRDALAAGDFLDAYSELFQINDSAPAVVKDMYAAEPENDADQQAQAFFLVLTGRAEDALAVLDALPDSAFTYTLRAVANDLLGNNEDAAAALALAVERADDDAQVYGFVANAAFVNFNVESMMTNSTKALELDPDLALALRAHGLANLFSGDPQAALADADREIALDPSFYGFHTLRANIHLALEEPDAALAELDAALALNPDSFVANGIRAGLNQALGNSAAAARDFAAAVNVKTVEIVEGESIEAGKPVSLTMTLGRTFRLPFEGQVDQRMTIRVTSANPGEVDPVVLLLSPEGIPLTFNDDASDETLDAQIADYPTVESGPYTVVVSHANGGSEGRVEITLTLE